MKPKNKGWLKRYLEFRKKLGKQPDCASKINSDSENSIEEYLYCTLQPTGILYGYPLTFPYLNHPKMLSWSEKDRMKILLAESMISTGVYYYRDKIDSESDFEDLVHYLTKDMTNFYSEVYPHFLPRKRNYLGRKRDEIEVAEIILNQRIGIRQRFSKSFWTSFFQNSLLFLDIYYFKNFIDPKIVVTAELMQKEKENLRILILKIIAAAANANKEIEVEERSLYEYFLHSANLPPEKEREAMLYLDEGLELKNIEFSDIKSWVIKKYLLELSILTIMSDRVVNFQEKEFLLQLDKKLGFDDEELDKSMIAVESFVLQNWQQVHYLQEKHNYKIVSERYMQHIGGLVGKYKNNIKTEITESRELYDLLSKSRKQELTKEEKEKVRSQLIDVLKTLPVFAIIALPGSFLTLPILFKILPKAAFPTAFQEED